MDDLDNFLSNVTPPKSKENDLDAFLSTSVHPNAKPKDKGPINSPSRFKYHPDGWILPNPQRARELLYIASLDENSCASFDEWKACGYWILKGSKSHFTDVLGKPQFTKEQVKKSNW